MSDDRGRPPGAPWPPQPGQPQQPEQPQWQRPPQMPAVQPWQQQPPQMPAVQPWQQQPPQMPAAQPWQQQPPQMPAAQPWQQQPPQMPAAQPWQQQQPQMPAPQPPMPQPPAMRRTHLAAAVKPPSGQGFGAMAMLSVKRAFRLRIDANEVLEDERATMLAAKPAITDETQQAFMAWRRSVLFVAALLMIPVAVLHAIENLDFDAMIPDGWRALEVVGTIVEGGFALFLWTQVGKWTAWRSQSRRLSWAWLVYFLVPFLMFLYPLASSIDYSQLAGPDTPLDAATEHAAKVAIGIAIGAQAFLSLAPKIISLLQGLIRASIATKTLFPGASAPGWLMVLAAPLYMIVFYVFVLLPYHFTGSGLVVVGTLLVLAAKSSLVRAGLGLTRPMTDEVARHTTHRAQTLWMTLLLGGIGCIIGGLWDLVSRASALSLVNFALSMGANILLLTLISTDALISALDRARGVTPDERKLAEEAQGEIAAFTAART